eukprot:scaffold115219_cov59-Phaeocystis_antarctica.AAC.1
MTWAYFTVHTPLVPGFNHLLLVSQCHYATRSYPRGGCSLRRWSELFCMSLLCELVVNGVNLESRSSLHVGRQLKTSLARATAIRATGLIHEGTASSSRPTKLDEVDSKEVDSTEVDSKGVAVGQPDPAFSRGRTSVVVPVAMLTE